MTAEEAVTVRVLAGLLGLHIQTVYQMISAKRIPHIRVGETGRGIRCFPSEVKTALADQPADPWAAPRSKRRAA